jgi:MprA protease rhombosortase-interaction domain-containing protein
MVALATSFSVRASAAVVGSLSTANASGQGVTISNTNIDFLPAAGGTGTDETGAGTAVTFSGGGPLGSGVAGLVKDVTFVTPLPLQDFMLFPSQPLLHFDLLGFAPGVANLSASTTLNPNNPPNSPVSGSPFILAPTTFGTTLTFGVFGTARDGSADVSNWSGLFTTQFPGQTPAQVTATLGAGGAVSSTWSAAFTATGIIPEPASAGLLVAAGLAGCSLRRSRRG